MNCNMFRIAVYVYIEPACTYIQVSNFKATLVTRMQ